MRKKIWIAYIAIMLALIVGTYTITMSNSNFPLLLSDTQMGKLSGGFENTYCHDGADPPCTAKSCSNYDWHSYMTGDTASDTCDTKTGSFCNYGASSGVWCIVADWAAYCDHIESIWTAPARQCN